MHNYKFSETATDKKPDTPTTRLLEKALTGAALTRDEKNRVAAILYGTGGAQSSTYKLAGWAWPMHTVLPRFLVRQYDAWQTYWAPDKTSLRHALPGPIQEIVEAPRHKR